MLDIVKKWVPFAHDAFVAYRQNATQISGKTRDVINRKLIVRSNIRKFWVDKT